LVLEYTETPAISGETQHDINVDAWMREFREHLFLVLGRFPETATTNDKYLALAYTVRAHLLGRWVRTSQMYMKKRARTV
jgi:glycogen phosphorylase